MQFSKEKALVESGKEKKGLTSVSLNELLIYKNVVFLAAYSGLLTWEKETEGVGSRRRRRTDNGKRKQRSGLELTHTLSTVAIK